MDHLRRRFQASVAAEDVRAGKPAPDVFLAAASRLDVGPSACIVVEDARTGIEAAQRAGVRSIAVGKTAASLGADLAAQALSDLAPARFPAFSKSVSRQVPAKIMGTSMKTLPDLIDQS